jgi:hypothetical protein
LTFSLAVIVHSFVAFPAVDPMLVDLSIVKKS